jgi:hypothetical protein
MNKLHYASVVTPEKQVEFNQWVKEFKVSSAYTEDKILQKVLEDEDRRLQSEYYLANKSAKKNKQNIIKKIIKSLV